MSAIKLEITNTVISPKHIYKNEAFNNDKVVSKLRLNFQLI